MAYHLASLLPWPFPHYRSYLLHHPLPAYLGTGLRLLRRRRGDARAAARAGGAGAARRRSISSPCRWRPTTPSAPIPDFPDIDSAIARGGGELRPRRAGRGAAAGEGASAGPRAEALAAARLRRIAAAAGVAGRVHLPRTARCRRTPVIAGLPRRGHRQQHARRAGDRAGPAGDGAGPGDLRRAGPGWQGAPDAFWQRGAAARPGAGRGLPARHRRLPACARSCSTLRPGLDAGAVGGEPPVDERALRPRSADRRAQRHHAMEADLGRRRSQPVRR